MDLHEVVPARPPSKLSECLDERHALHVADCATKLDDAHIRLLACVIDRYACNFLDPFLDRVCNVRNDLHRLA